MAIQGLRDSEQFITNQRPTNFREGLMLAFPNGGAPLTALTTLMKQKSTDDPRFAWFEKVMEDERYLLTADLTAGGTTFTVSSGASGIKAGDLLRVEQTGEIVRVTTDPANDTDITVLRSVGDVAGTALDVTGLGSEGNNPFIHKMGSAYEEGSSAPTGISFDPTEYFNFTQIFRDTLEITRTASKTRLRTGEAVKEAKREALLYHSLGIEKALWLGDRSLATLNGKPMRTTKGIIPSIPAARQATWGTDNAAKSGVDTTAKDLSAFEDLMANVIFEYGSDEKMAWCGNQSLLTFQRLARLNSDYQLVQGQKEFGMNVSRLVSPFGELILKRHPLFTRLKGGLQGDTPTTYYGLNSSVVILDMEDMVYRHFSGDDMRYEQKLEENGLDGMKSGYITECGLELHHQNENHIYIDQFVGAAVG